MSDKGLTEQVILFARFLKRQGFKVFPPSVVDALRSLEQGGISEKRDFRNILRSNFTSSDVEWTLFQGLFETFWSEAPKDEAHQKGKSREALPECLQDLILDPVRPAERREEADRSVNHEKACLEGAFYSPVALVEKKDLSSFDRGDIRIAELVLKNMMASFRLSEARRFKRSRKPGNLHFRLILKKSLKGGGIPLELCYRRKKKRLKKAVILVDVSGSMDRYARYVMPFIMGLRGVGSRADVYVFSTSLTAITRFVRKLPIDKALDLISGTVPDWSGGTRIGDSLKQFNEQYGRAHLNKRTVAVIMSDGWDLGAKGVLRKEMQTLAQRVHSVLWLNPVAGDPEYRPLCKGMQTVLPFVDHLLPADSLQSLRKVGRTLTRVIIPL